MDDDREYPSLMDDAEFLVELEKVEGQPLPAALHARAPQDATPTPLRRDSDRYQLNAERRAAAGESQRQARAPGPAPAALAGDVPEHDASGSLVTAFVMILIGLSAGAASAAIIFHDRVAWLVAHWAPR